MLLRFVWLVVCLISCRFIICLLICAGRSSFALVCNLCTYFVWSLVALILFVVLFGVACVVELLRWGCVLFMVGFGCVVFCFAMC